MHFKNSALGLAVAATVAAQRPENTTVCDYYTTALLKNNTAENQLTLLTLVVNTAVIGNYTTPNVGIKVAGILAPGKLNDTDVNLMPYFDGTLESSNRGGKTGVSVNFLDGGGAEPLMKNKPANDEKSNQYFLLTHLYEFFGALLGCSMYGKGAFPAYMGEASMYEVHTFMDLNPYQLGYFIEQVGLSAASFGVTQEDATAVGMALGKLFGYRCAPAATVIPDQGDQLQSICIDGACPMAEGAVCDKYMDVFAPKNHTSGMNATAPGSSGSNSTPSTTTSSMMSSMTMGPTSSPTKVPSAGFATNAAASAGLGFAALFGGLAWLVL